MCTQVRSSLPEVQPTGHPGDPRVLDKVGGLAPSCCETGKEYHLFSCAIGMWEGIDDSRRGIARECRPGVQFGNLAGCCRISDVGAVVVQTIHGDCSALLDPRALKACQVGE